MKIQFPFELLDGTEVEVSAKVYPAQKSYSNGDRFAEPDDEDHVEYTITDQNGTAIDFNDLLPHDQNEIYQTACDQYHETEEDEFETEFEYF